MELREESPPSWHNLLRAIFLGKITISLAHKIITSMFPTVTLEEVQAFYANEQQPVVQQNTLALPHNASQQPKPDAGIDTTKQETKKDPTLLNVPEVPMKQILSSINYTDQKHLRRTCKVVQPFLDEKVIVYETIGLHLTVDGVEKCFKEARANGETETSGAKKRKLESDEIYFSIDETVEFLQKFINKPDLKVKTVYFTHGQSEKNPTEDQKKYFYRRIQEVFQGMKTKLNAESVELYVENQNVLHSILTKLQEGTLTDLSFNRYLELMPVIDMKDIVVLPQWSGLKYFKTWAKLRVRVADFKHLKYVTAGFEAITIDEIKDLRNQIFNSRNSRRFMFYYDFNKEEVEDAMQPFTLVESGGHTKGRFLRADNKTADFFLTNHFIRMNSYIC